MVRLSRVRRDNHLPDRASTNIHLQLALSEDASVYEYLHLGVRNGCNTEGEG